MSRNELKQYIFDFETGKVLEFDIENTELLLMKDPTVYEEYVQLSGKRKKTLCLFISENSMKKTLYIPVFVKQIRLFNKY